VRVTTKGRFAVTALVDLACHGQAGPVALAAISARQKISLCYLEQLFCRLRRQQLVESVRGPGGGYCLARPIDAITVAQIIAAVDERMDATQCGGRENCLDDRRCLTHDLWANLNQRVSQYLESVTLRHLVEGQGRRPVRVYRAGRPAPRDSDPSASPIRAGLAARSDS
jgi:Rrf2 family transcriptional regulator, iron-sulfur cluster assembly transcription factor